MKFGEMRYGLVNCRCNDILRAAVRESEGREDSPSAAIIDSQSVKATEQGGERGYDAGKKVNGRKRHILVDTIGLLTGQLVERVKTQFNWILQIVERCDKVTEFQVLPRRWVVEHTLAWLSRNRRLSKDYEVLPQTTEAFCYLAMIHSMVKRLAPKASG